LQRQGKAPEVFLDIRNVKELDKFINKQRPSAIIHLAAQPIVLESYKNPLHTFETNTIGTANILDCAFKSNSVQAIVVVSTDKVYRNSPLGRSFSENDPLGGRDPYSASKVGAEAVTAAWQHISKINGGPTVVSVRSGNVIGGGDLAENRLMPDLIRGFSKKELVTIRNPESTRPWQHVLDPLKGYLMAMEAALSGKDIDTINYSKETQNSEIESVDLQLNSSKARNLLKWHSRWRQLDAAISTIEWWDKVLNRSIHAKEACESDLNNLLLTQSH
jgi:CDP-glucose 4,6-dehydratase